MASDIQKNLNKNLRSLNSAQGANKTAVPYLDIYRFSYGDIKLPELNKPYIFYIADGSVRLHTPSGILDYVSGQYSVSTIDTPFSGQVISLSENNDFSALSIEFTADEVFSVLTSFEGNLAQQIANDKLSAAFKERADKNVTDCLIRLTALLNDEKSLEFMATHIKRELLFNVLCGSCGNRFLQSIIGTNQNGEIYDINTWIKRNFKENFTALDIAKQNNMSVSALHQKFKSAIGMGLLQCQKRLRLSEARRLLLNDEMNVTDAAMEVGYESVSQFIRDYKKTFGYSPKDDIKNLRSKFAGTGKK